MHPGARHPACHTSTLLARGRHARVALPPLDRSFLAGAAAASGLHAQLADG